MRAAHCAASGVVLSSPPLDQDPCHASTFQRCHLSLLSPGNGRTQMVQQTTSARLAPIHSERADLLANVAQTAKPPNRLGVQAGAGPRGIGSRVNDSGGISDLSRRLSSAAFSRMKSCQVVLLRSDPQPGRTAWPRCPTIKYFQGGSIKLHEVGRSTSRLSKFGSGACSLLGAK